MIEGRRALHSRAFAWCLPDLRLSRTVGDRSVGGIVAGMLFAASDLAAAGRPWSLLALGWGLIAALTALEDRGARDALQAFRPHAQAQLAPAGEDLLLDLPGHARLLGAALGRRVAVGVCGTRDPIGA